MIPSAYDRVAVAVLVAARMAYAVHQQWWQERYAEPLAGWADAGPDTHEHWVNRVLILANNPDMTAADIHNTQNSLMLAAAYVEPDAVLAYHDMPPIDRADDAATTAVIRAVLASLVPPKDVDAYIARLSDGTDEYLRPN